MDDQKIWNIINSHFKDNYQSLVKHHIDSYNDFFENKIYEIFKQENPISFMTNYDNKLDEHRNTCEIYVGGKDGKLIGSWIAYHLKTTLNWGLCAALGAILLAVMLVFYWLYNKIVGIDNIKLG